MAITCTRANEIAVEPRYQTVRRGSVSSFCGGLWLFRNSACDLTVLIGHVDDLIQTALLIAVVALLIVQTVLNVGVHAELLLQRLVLVDLRSVVLAARVRYFSCSKRFG